MITIAKKPYSKKDIEKILTPMIKKWFYSRFKEFSIPQLFAVPEIHKRRNVLISAPTGSTKTLTAFLSILNELADSAQKGILEDRIYCVYVSPLKALSNDIEVNLKRPLKEIEKLAGKELGIRIAVRTGDTTQYEKSKMLAKPPHILITTPESLGIILSSPRFSEHLRNVQWVIVDEIHALAENKRGVHLSLSLERLQRLSKHIARIGLSATIAPLEDVARFLVGLEEGLERDCIIIDVQFMKKMDLKVITPTKGMFMSSQKAQAALYASLNNMIKQHKTTLIFTNTRSGTERVVDKLKELYSKDYNEQLGAHHGSLSKKIRHKIEHALRNGSLKAVVSSTSLELGIDIGFIDLVICLGSPKSIARFIQRAGRAGHRLHDTVKGRIVVLNRDDLVECAVLLKHAIERKIDKIRIPKNCLDVLAQHIHGIAVSEKMHISELFKLVKRSYCYKDLKKEDFIEVIRYLSGEFASLEDRHVYAKIWFDPKNGMIGKKGRLSRVIYMTNVGTIPEETYVLVKQGEEVIGMLDEAFLERLKPGDIFVLGGNLYEFRYARGMTVQVKPTAGRPPTVPSWFSEMLPLSFDLALDIGRFRRLLYEKFRLCKSKKEIISFIKEYLYLQHREAKEIFDYFKEQFEFMDIPTDKRIIIEHFVDDKGWRYAIFHTLFGRRVNDCLSRAVGFILSKNQNRDIEIGINDNGFYVRSKQRINLSPALRMLKAENLETILRAAIERTEILKRRFRHCASRALMILRNYKGKRKMVWKQQFNSTLLLSAVKRIDPDFCILKEARREVLEDVMDISNAKIILKAIERGEIKIEERFTSMPSPFAFNIVLESYADILRIEEKMEFLKRMHQMMLASIALKKGKQMRKNEGAKVDNLI